MKKARVSVIKNNIQKGTPIPKTNNDCEMGQWVDQTLEGLGHTIDKNGLVDIPEFNTDNKSRKKGSKCPHTVGSMTTDNIVNTKNFNDTRYWHKVQNQNQIEYDTVFDEISDVHVLDMDIPEIQDRLAEGYDSCRKKLIDNLNAGHRPNNIVSDNGWVILDGYGHHNSYRMRISDKAMKKIKTISGNRDTFKKHFEEL